MIRMRVSLTRAGLAVCLGLMAGVSSNAAPRPEAMADGYITGRVTSEAGPEAGVWVIAETDESKTPMIKIVVTDDDGRFALPELPEATYDVWVRGYVLVDSERVDPGVNPPETCITGLYQVPDPGFDPRGIDIDSTGMPWLFLAGSSHVASFDRNQCDVLNGPEALDGTHCETGWTLYRTDGPTFKGTDVPAEFQYFGWVDQHNLSGFGHDTPIATGSNSDALLVLDPESGDWTKLRVPYPLGFYHRGLDGRIDDPEAGWKGRGLWANYGTHLIWHVEGGKGTPGKAVKFQIRPDPLAF